jgi:hypothetical protein
LAISLEKPPRICCIAIWCEAVRGDQIRNRFSLRQIKFAV